MRDQTISYRLATLDDVPLLARLRAQQLRDEEPDAVFTRAIDEELRAYFTRQMQAGTLTQYLAEYGGAVIGTGALVLMAFPPCFQQPCGLRGYIANMYTRPDWRGRGIATTLLQMLSDVARHRGLHELFLIPSSQGRPVYQRFGFTTDGWMGKRLD